MAGGFTWSNEQKEAIDKEGCNIIVSAGAGSGKTAVLTTRIERKLMEGVRANELLVLTFTNAAAAETKARVVKKMKENESLKDRSDEVDNAYFTTFDSFALSIVKRYHYKLNLSSKISILSDSVLNVYKRQVINELFDAYYVQNNALFDRLLNDLTIKNDNSIRSSLLNLMKKIDLLIDKESYLDSYLTYYYKEETFQEYLNELTGILNEKIRYIKKNLDLMEPLIKQDQFKKYYEALGNLMTSTSYDDIRFNCKIKMPTCRLEEQAKAYKEEIKSTLDSINELCPFTNASFAREAYFDSKEYVEILLELLKQAYQKIEQYKKDTESFEFIDIAKMAISLVKNYPEIALELKHSFKEILIDEYQDTNDLQEEFISYISDNNVYMVGDIKQSIYRFRNANPTIFKNKYDHYKKLEGGYKIDLNQNFRSNRSVLNIINDLFDHIMDDEVGQANFKEEHRMRFGFSKYDEGSNQNKIKYVSYQNFEKKYKNSDIEMFIVLKDIQEKLAKKEIVYDADAKIFRPCEYRDFAILIASSTNFNTIRSLLEFHHIPTCILKNEEVGNSIVVPLLNSIVTLLTQDFNQKYDETFLRNFYGVGRSFICQIQDEILFDMVRLKTYKESELYSKIHNLSQKIPSLSIKQLLEEVIDSFGIIEKLITIGQIDSNMTRIEYILNIASSMETLSMDIFDFNRYIEDIFASQEKLEFASSGANENKVKIMTIHKSKGLEFPIVYFVNNFKTFNTKEYKEKIIFDTKYGMITPYNIQGEGKNITYYLMKEKNMVDMISEQIRLLYVALTRAREQIIIISPENKVMDVVEVSSDLVNVTKRKKYNSFKKIYDSVLYLFDSIKQQVDIDTLQINEDYHMNLKSEITSFLNQTTKTLHFIEREDTSRVLDATHASKESKTLASKEEILAMEYGTHIHAVFECIDFIHPNYDTLSTKEAEYVKQFLKNPLFANMAQGKIYKEYEFIECIDGKEVHGIIDLMIVYNTHIDIIDYKLSHVEDVAYNKQLQTYQTYICQKTHKKVHTYLYSVLTNTIKELEGVNYVQEVY